MSISVYFPTQSSRSLMVGLYVLALCLQHPAQGPAQTRHLISTLEKAKYLNLPVVDSILCRAYCNSLPSSRPLFLNCKPAPQPIPNYSIHVCQVVNLSPTEVTYYSQLSTWTSALMCLSSPYFLDLDFLFSSLT